MMKLLITFLLLAQVAIGQTLYYWDPVDGSDANNGTSSATPWKTVTKINSSQSGLASHYKILIKRGTTVPFDAGWPLVPAKNGTAANVNGYGAYGTGAMPIFSGFQTVTGWVQIGSTRVFESAALTGQTTTGLKPIMLTIDGVAQTMGRYPNTTDPESDASTPDNNIGYLTVDAMSTDKKVITDNDPRLDSVNIVGCQCATHTNNYIQDTNTVTAQTANTFTLRVGTHYQMAVGYGYFFQNCPQTLNKHGEWYYDPTTRKIKMYIDAGHTPGEYLIKASVIAQAISLTGDQYLKFDSIRLEGFNANAVQASGSTTHHIWFTNTQWFFIGSRGFDGDNNAQKNFGWSNNIFYRIYDQALDLREMGDSMTIRENNFKQIGNDLGQFGNAPGHAYCIQLNRGSYHNIIKNFFDSIGYIPIRFQGSHIYVDSNVVQNFNMILDDGGGIYCCYQHYDSTTYYVNRNIRYNIIREGIGNKYGAGSHTPFSNGIYSDNNGHNINVIGNTIYNISRNGILYHHTPMVNSFDNTVYNANGNQVFWQYNNHDAKWLYGHVFRRNILISRIRLNTAGGQLIHNYDITTDSSTRRAELPELDYMGTSDSNFYLAPTRDMNNTTNTVPNGGGIIRHRNTRTGSAYNTASTYTLSQWRTEFPQFEAATKTSPITKLNVPLESFSRFDVNDTYEPMFFEVDSNHIDAKGVLVGPPGYTLGPLQSRFLLATGEPPPTGNVAPNASAGSDQEVQLPFTSTITLYPSDDVYARQSVPTTSFATADTLVTKTNTSGSFTRRSFLKFDLNPVTNVQSATLRLYGRNNEDAIVQAPAVMRVTNDSWFENTLTWQNMPSYGAWIANLSFGATSAWSTANVTPYAQSEFSGDKLISFQIWDSLLQNKNVSYHAKEKVGGNKPELVVVSDGVLQLNGTGSFDNDGTITYNWTKQSGPTGGTITGGTTATPIITNLNTGTYVYRLTVTDDDGATSIDDMNVVVSATVSNQAPSANAGINQSITLPTNSITVNAEPASEDPDGSIVAYFWTKLSLPAATITNPNQASTTITGMAQGIHTFRLRVTDNDGAFAEDDITITVNPAPTPPSGPGKGKKRGTKGVSRDGKIATTPE
jgi:hypothetical protein